MGSLIRIGVEDEVVLETKEGPWLVDEKLVWTKVGELERPRVVELTRLEDTVLDGAAIFSDEAIKEEVVELMLWDVELSSDFVEGDTVIWLLVSEELVVAVLEKYDDVWLLEPMEFIGEEAAALLLEARDAEDVIVLESLVNDAAAMDCDKLVLETTAELLELKSMDVVEAAELEIVSVLRSVVKLLELEALETSVIRLWGDVELSAALETEEVWAVILTFEELWEDVELAAVTLLGEVWEVEDPAAVGVKELCKEEYFPTNTLVDDAAALEVSVEYVEGEEVASNDIVDESADELRLDCVELVIVARLRFELVELAAAEPWEELDEMVVGAAAPE
jgi:hypothetical protein